MYQGTLQKKKAEWPHHEYEVVQVFGRTTTLTSLLMAAESLGRPFAIPPPPERQRMKPKKWGIPSPRRTKANKEREHKRALAQLRNVEANADADVSTEEESESEESEKSSDDDEGTIAGLFDPNKGDLFQYPPQSLLKGKDYHLPVLQISGMNM
jgi:hypothetical protein